MIAASRILAALFALLFATTAQAAPRAELWPRWQAHDPASVAVVDHGAWDRWLAAFVVPGADGVNRVAYGRARTDGRAALDSYVAALEAVAVSRLRRPEQMAYWINLYNAVTVRVVLDHFPVDSILKIGISPGWFSRGPWGAKLATVEGERLSLDDIEHRILRPIWRDARIHYAVNCASIGCPNLRREAFVAARLDRQLDEQARDYVNAPRGARVADGALHVSSIFKWYAVDFGGDDAGVLAHLRRFASAGLAAKLATVTRIAGDHYDWSLNDAAAPAAQGVSPAPP